ncbi:MAG TPA: YibE/F family protein [Chloroflexi bacterium]|nr:YibE/F family protein [Chloroflexota bacterium]
MLSASAVALAMCGIIRYGDQFMNALGRSRTIGYVLEGVGVLTLAILVVATLALHLTRPPIPYAQQHTALGITVQARVEEILDEHQEVNSEGQVTVAQRMRVRILTKGPHYDEVVTVTYNGTGSVLSAVRFRPGARALIMISELPNNPQAPSDSGSRTVYQVADHVRLLPLALIAASFALLTIVIGRWQGVRALIGLAFSGLLIGAFILPQILAHRDPVMVTLVGTALLLAVTLYLIQGWNPPSHAALLGMIGSLALTGLLAIVWTDLARLTGFGSEETMFLQATGVTIPMRGLLLAGMILGTAGVLDDVVLAQTITVFELANADPTQRPRVLYTRGMRVGVAHLASMINTLVLAYASTALPLLILFYLYPEPWYLTINRELIAEEILRAVVGSVGLMLAVPLTTAIAAWVACHTQGGTGASQAIPSPSTQPIRQEPQ